MNIRQWLMKLEWYHTLWVGILVSILFTEIMVISLSILFRGSITYDYLISGVIAAFLVSLIVLSIIIYFTKQLRQIERQAMEDAEKFRSIFDNATDGMLLADLESKKFYDGNRMICQMLGYSHEEIKNLWITDIHPEKDLAHIFDRFEKQARKEITLSSDIPVKRKDGTTFNADIKASKITSAGREYLIAILRDVTERRQAEEALLLSRERYLNTLENMLEGCQIIGFDWRYIYVNDAVARHGRKTKEELLGHKMMEIYPGIENTKMFAALRQCMDERVPHRMENEFAYPDGNKGYFELSIQPVPEGVFILSIDITERKKAEEVLRESEEKYRRLVENLKERYLFYSHNTDGIFTYLSPSVTNILGYTQEEFLTHFMEYLTDNPVNKDVASRTESSIKGIPQPPYLVEIFHKDRSIRWLEVTEVLVFDKKRKVVAVEGIACDITEKKMAEQRQKTLYEFSQRVVSNLDLDFRLRSVCHAVSEMGYKMTWIGILKEDTKDVIPRAQAGFEDGYLSSIKVKFDDSPLGQGPTGRAIKNKRLEIQDHITTDPRYEPWREAAMNRGYGSSATFPIIDKDRVIAVLNVYHTEDEFPQSDVDFLQTFANQTAAYIRNAQLFGELEESADSLRQEMEITSHLLIIAEATAHTADIDKLMEHVIHCSHEIMGCNICLSYLWDNETNVFRPGQEFGLSHNLIPLFKTESLDMKIGFVKEAMKKREPVIEKVGAVHGLPLQWIESIGTIAVIPLIGKKGPLGMIVGIYQAGEGLKPATTIEERDMKVMKGISHQVSIALEEARLFKESVDKAMELSHKIEMIKTMHEIDRSILSALEPREILGTVTRLVAKVIPCDRTTVDNVDREKQVFSWSTGFGSPFLEGLKSAPFEDTSAAEVVKTGRAEYIANLKDIKKPLPIEKGLLKEGFLSHIRVPIMAKGEVFAILSVGAKRPSAFTPENLTTLEYLGAQIGVALNNAKLITDLMELFMGTVKSLSSAIDAKSPWTAGHSERVTRYALDIGNEMQLSEKELKDLELAGLLHDIGKIGIYEAILDKPGALSDEEMRVMRQHPGKGSEIVSTIKQLEASISGIRHHHEFYNGEGYPDGLKGEAIPLFARILAVADTVDAMDADRPYREGKPIDVIVAELKRCSGIQFDPKVVKAYLKTIEQ